eukprot:1209033-Pyramimonas_sp.AAC.1
MRAILDAIDTCRRMSHPSDRLRFGRQIASPLLPPANLPRRGWAGVAEQLRLLLPQLEDGLDDRGVTYLGVAGVAEQLRLLLPQLEDGLDDRGVVPLPAGRPADERPVQLLAQGA